MKLLAERCKIVDRNSHEYYGTIRFKIIDKCLDEYFESGGSIFKPIIQLKGDVLEKISNKIGKKVASAYTNSFYIYVELERNPEWQRRR